MKHLWPIWLFALPALAAVDGTVTNRTTGQPQAGATVILLKTGTGGMEAGGQTKSDAQGKFSIAGDVQGPSLVQAVWQGIAYNLMLPAGTPATGLDLKVYNTSAKQPADAKVTQHVILFEPGNGQLSINEIYIVANTGTVTWNDPDSGTLRFYLPAAANGKAEVKCTAPQGMPVQRTAEKARGADTYKLDFAIKPGETRIDVGYTVPFAGGEYAGRVVGKDESTRLVTPAGVTLSAANLTPLGTDPQSKANIYDLKGSEYNVTIGTEGGAGQQESAGPQIEQIMPRIYGNTKTIVGLALGILALGFALLYRSAESAPAAAARETNERGRR